MNDFVYPLSSPTINDVVPRVTLHHGQRELPLRSPIGDLAERWEAHQQRLRLRAIYLQNHFAPPSYVARRFPNYTRIAPLATYERQAYSRPSRWLIRTKYAGLLRIMETGLLLKRASSTARKSLITIGEVSALLVSWPWQLLSKTYRFVTKKIAGVADTLSTRSVRLIGAPLVAAVIIGMVVVQLIPNIASAPGATQHTNLHASTRLTSAHTSTTGSSSQSQPSASHATGNPTQAAKSDPCICGTNSTTGESSPPSTTTGGGSTSTPVPTQQPTITLPSVTVPVLNQTVQTPSASVSLPI